MNVKVEVSKEAQAQVQALIKAQKPGTAVRLFVQAGGGGGCGSGCGCGAEEAPKAASTPTFGLAFDHARSGDEVIPVDGFQVVIDPTSAEFANGARIDFVQGLDATGFTVKTPGQGATTPPIGSGCGCGSGGGGGCC